MNMKELNEMLISLTERVGELEAKLENVKVRDRGPASTKTMSDDDARRIMLGDLSDTSHKNAAIELGLSYGQVYSARNGFTFKSVYKEYQNAIAIKS